MSQIPPRKEGQASSVGVLQLEGALSVRREHSFRVVVQPDRKVPQLKRRNGYPRPRRR